MVMLSRVSSAPAFIFEMVWVPVSGMRGIVAALSSPRNVPNVAPKGFEAAVIQAQGFLSVG